MPKRTPTPPKARYLFLLRHAKAVPYGKGDGDFERQLSERGLADAAKMAVLFQEQGFAPARTLCSPALRTRQTFKALADVTAGLKVSYPKDLYLIDQDALLLKLRKLTADPASVLVVGHNPGLEVLALMLADPKAGGDAEGLARMQAKFPTGTLAVLRLSTSSWKELAPGTCRLEAFVRPKDIEPAT